VGRTHGRLDIKPLHVLPVLLEQADELVHSHNDVDAEVFRGKVNLANRHAQAHRLLALESELDRRLELVYLGLHVLSVADTSWELSGLREAGAHQTRKLLDECGGGNEGVVLLS